MRRRWSLLALWTVRHWWLGTHAQRGCGESDRPGTDGRQRETCGPDWAAFDQEAVHAQRAAQGQPCDCTAVDSGGCEEHCKVVECGTYWAGRLACTPPPRFIMCAAGGGPVASGGSRGGCSTSAVSGIVQERATLVSALWWRSGEVVFQVASG